MRNALLTLVQCGALLIASSARAEIDWSRVDAAVGRSGLVIGTSHRYELPRPDLGVTLDGVALGPGLVSGWVAFLQIGRYAMMRGDLLVAESEATPALNTLLAQGIRVAGAHNHLLRARPATTHLHVAGYGDPVKMAQAVRDASRASKTEKATDPPSALSDLAQIESVLGAKAQMSLGAWRFIIPRAEEVRASGAPTPPAMGAATLVTFQPMADGTSAVVGEFAALPGEVSRLVEAVRSGGFEIAGLCDHMQDDQPRLTFVHVFARGDALQLAFTIERALQILGVDAASIRPEPAPARVLTWR